MTCGDYEVVKVRGSPRGVEWEWWIDRSSGGVGE
jgi:hypothetical protein